MVAIKTLVSSVLASTPSLLSTVESFSSVLSHCDITNNVNTLVNELGLIDHKITPASNLTLNFVGLAFGVQNYTCTQSNNFT